jgi:hypothetical protein
MIVFCLGVVTGALIVPALAIAALIAYDLRRGLNPLERKYWVFE